MARPTNKIVDAYTRQLGANIQHVRLSKSIELPAVAKTLAISVTMLKKIEAGNYPTVKITTLLQLADYYEVSIYTFFEGIRLNRD